MLHLSGEVHVGSGARPAEHGFSGTSTDCDVVHEPIGPHGGVPHLNY